MGLLSRSDKINRSPRLGDYFSSFCFNAAESQLQSILSNVAGEEFMKGSVATSTTVSLIMQKEMYKTKSLKGRTL